MILKKRLAFFIVLYYNSTVAKSWRDGRVWLKAHDWKSCWCKSLAGSNPVLSAKKTAPVKTGAVFFL